MFRKMLVCTDLSPASDALIQCVGELKSLGMEEVVLTHVIYVANTPGLEEMLAEDARPILQRQKKVLEAQGIRVVVEMPFGVPAHTLDEVAVSHNVSAILIGSHGKGILQAATLGSTTAKLLHQTQFPLLLARLALLEDGKCQVVCGRMFVKVLFPTDFSEAAERALDYLGKIVLDTGCSVTLLHVLGQKGDRENAQFLLEAKKRRLETLGATEVTIELVDGDPAEKIVSRTKGADYSLVVMGSQGKGVVEEIFLGSVANQVARQAGIPALLIPVAD